MSCGYTGSHFGATYPDAICIDGELWDLDSCAEPGSSMLHRGGDIPCPVCDPKGFIEYHTWVHASGNSHQRRKDMRAKVRRLKQKIEDGTI
ncbi:MAG: hypothetical protein RR574_19510 [Comamonas sp.]